jgi:hypothetical protein
MFQAVSPPIIRSSNCTYSFWYLSKLAAIMAGMELKFHRSHENSRQQQIPDAVCRVWTPDDGQRNHLKHVEHFIEINKLRNVADCWVYFGNILKMDGIMNIKDIQCLGKPDISVSEVCNCDFELYVVRMVWRCPYIWSKHEAIFCKVWYPRCASRIHNKRRNIIRQCTTLL